MKLGYLKMHWDRNRPMTTVSIWFPIDVIKDLKRATVLVENLKRHSVSAEVVNAALNEVAHRRK